MSSEAKFQPKVNPVKLTAVLPGNEIVISGIAGRFPESDNVAQLTTNLMSGRNLITTDDRRWKLESPDIPKSSGKVNNLEKFDSTFFGIKDVLAHKTDPQGRMLLEHAFEAVMDAGVNPRSLRGTRTGVFVGNSLSETENDILYDDHPDNALGFQGSARSTLAHRISYYLGTVAPSFIVDTACSSSHCALENAYRAIHDGQCDAALVGGVNLTLQPVVTKHLYTLGVLSPDGECRTFDETMNGYVRSEAAVVIFLQKAKNAKRTYATLVHAKMNCDGYKEEGFAHPSGRMHAHLLKEFYLECGVPPEKVSYVEPHGTGTKVGDLQEITAIDTVISHMRSADNPLLISSIKTNLGHTECASGLVSIVKAIVMMENRMIPPHLHFKKPRNDFAPIVDGRIKIVTELTPWQPGYVSICGLGLGGINVHILLKPNLKEKVNNAAPCDNLPRLVAVSGRTADAVLTLLNNLENKPVDTEYTKLLHDLFSDNINGHLYRGYIVLPAHGIEEAPIKEVKPISAANRPVVFVYPGRGCHQLKIGRALLEIPVFAETIRKCDEVLKSYGIDIYHILTTDDSTVFDNSLSTALAIVSVQLGLTDILSAIGVSPDLIIGHSLGEVLCGYADGCFTIEQAIMLTYYRSVAFSEVKCAEGAMYYVAVGYQQIKDLCPSDIDVACRNTQDSTTISGPTESVHQFAAKLQADGIFTKEVECNNIPHHSRYVAPIKTYLLARLKEVIPNPKPRSDRWISTSVLLDKGDTFAGRYASAEYITTNTTDPVLFDQALASIPDNAVTLEITPKGMFQAILRRSLSPGVTNIPLLQRDPEDKQALFQAIGKMYLAGLQPLLFNLYPNVEYPVSSKTQMIAPLIKWQHKDNWNVCYYNPDKKVTTKENVTTVPLDDSEIKTLAERIEDGEIQLSNISDPRIIREALELDYNKVYPEVSLAFKNVKFLPTGSLKCNGIEVNGVLPKAAAKDETNSTILEEYKFVPFLDEAEVSSDVVKLFAHLTLENYVGNVVKTVEILDDDKISYEELLTPRILDAFADTPLFQVNISVVSKQNSFDGKSLPSSVTILDPSSCSEAANAFFVICHHLLRNNDSGSFNSLSKYLEKGGFLLSRESSKNPVDVDAIAEGRGFHVIVKKKSGGELLVLLRRQEKIPENIVCIHVSNESFEWVDEMRKALTEVTEKKTSDDTRVYFIVEDFDSGLMGLITCLRREPGAKVVRGIQIQSSKAPKFSPNHPYYRKQIEKDLVMSVLREKDVWGNYKFSKLPPQILSNGITEICKDKKSTHFKCLPDRSYIVLGGFGGVGFKVVNWLIERGARYLVVVSRSGLKNDEHGECLNRWRRDGVEISVVTGKNAAVFVQCREIIEAANKLAAVDGVFNLANVYRDALWTNLSQEMFQESFASKAYTMKNLDILTRELCPKLRHLVVFSSTSCGRGYIGQSNYGMSNAATERICERRVAEGLPGLSIQWGSWRDVGIVAEMQKASKANKPLILNGIVPQPPNECFELLDKFLQENRPVVTSFIVAREKRQQTNDIKDTILNIIGINDSEGISPFATFSELGMDSMTTVEVKEALEEEFKITLTTQEVYNFNLNKIQEMRNKVAAYKS